MVVWDEQPHTTTYTTDRQQRPATQHGRTHCLVTTYNGKESEQEYTHNYDVCVCIQIYMNRFAVVTNTAL